MDDLLDRIDGYLDAVPRAAARVEDYGPFTVFVGTGPWPYYARPRRGHVGTFSLGDVAAVRARQRSLKVAETFEWIEELAPGLTPMVERSGLQVRAHPLMVHALQNEAHVALPAGTVLRLIDGDGDDVAMMQAVQAVAFATSGTAVGEADTDTLDIACAGVDLAGVEYLRDRLGRGLTVMAAAVDRAGHPVAVGAHQPVGAVSEIVGVATLPAQRRRGLGAGITAMLVADARQRGVTTVFLSATDAAVARIYERIGFHTVAVALVAEPAA